MFGSNMNVRPQYHFRQSERGLLAWDVVGLIERVSGLSPVEISLHEISEFDEPHWFALEGNSPTCREVAMHARLIEDADLAYPIIVDHEGRVMDGMHRVCKAFNLGMETILAYRLPVLPEPDFVGVSPDELSYEEGGVE